MQPFSDMTGESPGDALGTENHARPIGPNAREAAQAPASPIKQHLFCKSRFDWAWSRGFHVHGDPFGLPFVADLAEDG